MQGILNGRLGSTGAGNRCLGTANAPVCRERLSPRNQGRHPRNQPAACRPGRSQRRPPVDPRPLAPRPLCRPGGPPGVSSHPRPPRHAAFLTPPEPSASSHSPPRRLPPQVRERSGATASQSSARTSDAAAAPRARRGRLRRALRRGRGWGRGQGRGETRGAGPAGREQLNGRRVLPRFRPTRVRGWPAASLRCGGQVWARDAARSLASPRRAPRSAGRRLFGPV